MSQLDTILRRSVSVDTSGSEPPRGIQMIAGMAQGVYTQGAEDTGSVLSGRISLGILAAFILGAVAFYVWTNEIQGGG